MVKRLAENHIISKLFNGKALVVTGARQVGKSTLLRSIESQKFGKSIWLDCDEPDSREKLTKVSSTQLKKLIGNNNLVFIDEAQRVEDIGLTIKLIVDNIKDVQVVVSGSSALELSGKLNETLTGRKYEFHLFPLSALELVNDTTEIVESRMLENRLIYGFYPDVINHPQEEQIILKELVNSYLYKDILMLREIRKPHLIPKLLQAIALQLGNEVSNHELARMLEVDKETIERYLDLFEKMFIVFRLPSFSRNLRVELNKSKKIYFYDLGVRNALISNYNALSLRADTGALWENYLILERMKSIAYNPSTPNCYFWRTHQQQEIDYIEEIDGCLNAYEFKWNMSKNAKLAKTFSNTYRNHTFTVVSKDNYFDFIRNETIPS